MIIKFLVRAVAGTTLKASGLIAAQQVVKKYATPILFGLLLFCIGSILVGACGVIFIKPSPDTFLDTIGYVFFGGLILLGLIGLFQRRKLNNNLDDPEFLVDLFGDKLMKFASTGIMAGAKGAKHVAGAVGSVGAKTAQKISSAGYMVADTVGDAANSVGKFASSAKGKTDEVVSDVVGVAGNVAGKVADTVGDTAKGAKNLATNTISKVKPPKSLFSKLTSKLRRKKK